MWFLDLLKLVYFSGNSHNENIIPSCQPCVLTVCAPLVCIKNSILSCSLGLGFYWHPTFDFCLKPFSDNCYTEKTSLSLDGLVLGGYVLPWFDWALQFDSDKSCTKKHHFLSALNVIVWYVTPFWLDWAFKKFLAVWTLKQSTFFCRSFAWMI